MAKYIDSEKLKHILNNSKYYGKKQGNDFADMITECEAEDVVPVTHAKWTINEDEGLCVCMNCKSEFNDEDGSIIWNYWKYCPVCGANMNG